MARSKKRVSTPQVKRKEVPKRTLLPESGTSDRRLCWRFAHVDHDGPWGFDKVDPKTLCWMQQRLAEFERMTVNGAFHRSDYPGKEYDVARIPNSQALARLEEMGLGDMTKIWCLRLGGAPRLYGFLDGHVFHIV